jgi:hypothetical protein
MQASFFSFPKKKCMAYTWTAKEPLKLLFLASATNTQFIVERPLQAALQQPY